METVSIITVVYNGVDEIEETILSVLKQSYTQKEYIIIDGGSTDGTVDIIKRYQEQISYWRSECDGGIYDAMNKGVSFASGTWVNFMNSGDSFHNETVLDMIFDTVYPMEGVIYGSVCCFDRYKRVVVDPKDLRNLEKRSIFCHQSSFVRRDLLLKYPFDKSYKICSDYNLFYSLYKDGVRFTRINKCIANYEIERGISSRNFFLSEKESLKINNKWNKPLSMINFFFKVASFYSTAFLKNMLPFRVLKCFKNYKYRNH